VLEKSIKQLNRVSVSLGLVLGLVGLMPSSDIVLKSTVLSSSCVPISIIKYRVGQKSDNIKLHVANGDNYD